MEETEVQHILENDIQNILKACLGFTGNFTPKPQFPLKNGIQADLGVTDDSGNVLALFECKGSVGINDLVTGIGQVAQYQNHVEEKFEYGYSQLAKAFLVIPKHVLEVYELPYLYFPEHSGIILIDEATKKFISIRKEKMSAERLSRTKIISPYYVRDNRLGELYLGLKIIEAITPLLGIERITMKVVGGLMERVIINRGNARNISISLHGLGFVDHENRLTAEGQRHARMDYFEFCKNLAHDQVAPFLNVIMAALLKIVNEKNTNYSSFSTTLEEIKGKILEMFDNYDVLYLTESGSRYLSSWMNILKDDLRAISFATRDYNNMSINYLPISGNPFLMKEIHQSENFVKCNYVLQGVKRIPGLVKQVICNNGQNQQS